MHEAKVPDFLKASGQDMLQEATDELLGRYSHRSIARRLLTGLDMKVTRPVPSEVAPLA